MLTAPRSAALSHVDANLKKSEGFKLKRETAMVFVYFTCERQILLVLLNMQIVTLSGFIKAKARWISSPFSHIH